MRIVPTELSRAELNGLINGLVYPRPIAWVSTLSPDGARNLAPFSFFNAFCFHPEPVLGIGPGSRAGVHKDSLTNARETGELVVNLVSAALAETANLCSAELAPDLDEWELSGVEGVPSEDVRPERVRAAPAAFECRVLQVVDLGTDEVTSNALVIGRVTRVHVDDAAMDGMTPIPDALDLVGRMGGALWCTTRERFELARPRGDDPETITRPVREGSKA
ncbi:MAG: flavin reductase family protein [Solirubrobacteraceae bacterium]